MSSRRAARSFAALDVFGGLGQVEPHVADVAVAVGLVAGQATAQDVPHHGRRVGRQPIEIDVLVQDGTDRVTDGLAHEGPGASPGPRRSSATMVCAGTRRMMPFQKVSSREYHSSARNSANMPSFGISWT